MEVGVRLLARVKKNVQGAVGFSAAVMKIKAKGTPVITEGSRDRK